MSYIKAIRNTDSANIETRSSSSLNLDHSIHSFYELKSHDNVPLGKVNPNVAEAMAAAVDLLQVDHEHRTVHFKAGFTTESRTATVKNLVDLWRKDKVFKVLDGWRDELYVAYNPAHTPYFMVERAAAALFGIVTYGVHIVGYVPSGRSLTIEEKSAMKIWVPRRSFQKQTFPGMLDNTVAGGLGHPYGILETAIKECGEEAGLDPEFVAQNLTPSGLIVYEYYNTEMQDGPRGRFGYYQPEAEYVFDLAMPETMVPKVVDGEVDSFALMSVQEVKHQIEAGSFKNNCAMVQIDFFVRHGLLSPVDEPDYAEIVSRSHRTLPYPMM